MGVPHPKGAACCAPPLPAVPSCAATTPAAGSTGAGLQNAIATAGAAAKRTMGPAYVGARTATMSTRRGDMGAKPHPPSPAPQCGEGERSTEVCCPLSHAAPNCALDARPPPAGGCWHDVPVVDPRPDGRSDARLPEALAVPPPRALDS